MKLVMEMYSVILTLCNICYTLKMCSIISLEVSKECTLAKDISHKINSATPSPVVKASEVGELKQVMLEVKDLLQKLVNKQSLTLLSPATCHQFFQWLLHRVHTQATHHKSCSQKYSCKKTLLSILTIIIVINIYIHSKKLGRLT